MVFSEKALFLWSRLSRRVSLQSFCIQKRPPLPFVSQKSMLSPAGTRFVRSSTFSNGPQLGSVLEREEREARGERSLLLVLIPFSQLARAAWSPSFLPRPRNCSLARRWCLLVSARCRTR